MNLEIIRDPDIVLLETEDGWEQLQRDSMGDWSHPLCQLQLPVDEEGLTIKVRAAHTPIKTLKLYWKQRIDKPIMVLGDHWERGYGDLEWRGLMPERVLPWYFLTNDGAFTNGYGVKTGPNAMCAWQVDAHGVSLTADIRCGGAGVILGERQLDVAQVVAYRGKENQSAFEVAAVFCTKMCDKPVMPSHPVYGGNNWYYAYGKSSHENMVEDSRFISSLSDSKENRPYMVIDEGWQLCSNSGSDNGGPWIGNYRFPDMHKLAGEMEQIGVRPGIWFRPLLAHYNIPDSWKRYTQNGHFLDPSVPDVLVHISETIKNMTAWGYQLIKHDFSTFDLLGQWGFQMGGNVTTLPYTFADRSKTTAEIIGQFYQTISEASGNSLIIGCNTIGHLAAGRFEIQRTGDDTSGRDWERTRRMGINTLAFRMPQHGTFFSHDADCVGLTNDVPWELNRQWMDLLSASGTPLFVSASPTEVSKEQQKHMRDAFERASKPSPVAEPLDWLYSTSPSRWRIGDQEVEYDWTDYSLKAHSPSEKFWWK